MRFLIAFVLSSAALGSMAEEAVAPSTKGEEPSRFAESQQAAARFERIARAGVEKILRHVLDVPVKVDDVKLDAENEALRLINLRVANPERFQEADAFSFSEVEVAADLKSLFSREPEIRVVKAKGVTINSELSALAGGSNLKDLFDNATRFKPQKRGILGRQNLRTKWRIQKGVLENLVLNMSTTLFETKTVQKKVDDMEVHFSTPDGTGLTADKAVAQFLQQLMNELNIGLPALPF